MQAVAVFMSHVPATDWLHDGRCSCSIREREREREKNNMNNMMQGESNFGGFQGPAD